jgi:hypothetical protein
MLGLGPVPYLASGHRRDQLWPFRQANFLVALLMRAQKEMDDVPESIGFN